MHTACCGIRVALQLVILPSDHCNTQYSAHISVTRSTSTTRSLAITKRACDCCIISKSGLHDGKVQCSLLCNLRMCRTWTPASMTVIFAHTNSQFILNLFVESQNVRYWWLVKFVVSNESEYSNNKRDVFHPNLRFKHVRDLTRCVLH